MSICCGYLFFQRDTVYFLRRYFNPKWLEISPLEWPTRGENPTVREGAVLLFIETRLRYVKAPLPYGRLSEITYRSREVNRVRDFACRACRTCPRSLPASAGSTRSSH